MIEIRTEIIIPASANDIWQVLTNFQQYPGWNPFITQIVGKPSVGDTLQVTINPPQKKAMVFKPVIIECNPNQELRWVGKFIAEGLFRGEHYFCLEAIDANTTRFIHGEIFSGLLAKPILRPIRKATEAGFNLMNQALKDVIQKFNE